MAARQEDDDALAAGLERWLAAHRGLADPRVTEVQRPTSGFSSESRSKSVATEGSRSRRPVGRSPHRSLTTGRAEAVVRAAA